MLVVKNPPANAEDIRDVGLIPESGRSPRGGHGNPLQYSCLENIMDRGAWQVTVCGVTESNTTERLTLSFSEKQTSLLLFKEIEAHWATLRVHD